MYQFSRAIYRDLADDIVTDDRLAPEGLTPHEAVLRACEAAVLRLATDRHYFAKPTRTLFRDIRVYFPMAAQHRAYRVIERYLTMCEHWLASQPPTGFDAAGNRLECRATTRKGTPCQRMPLAHNGYCPSHQHLHDADEMAALAA